MRELKIDKLMNNVFIRLYNLYLSTFSDIVWNEIFV